MPKNINVESLKTGLTKAAGFVSIASGVIIVASEINDYYDDLQYVYALSTVDKEYNKTNIMLNSLIDNTNIDELKKAAKNVKSVIYEAQASCDTMKNTFLNDCIISGSIGVARVVASYLNPALTCSLPCCIRLSIRSARFAAVIFSSVLLIFFTQLVEVYIAYEDFAVFSESVRNN